MPTLYFAITNHGFGHATRSAALAAKISQCCRSVGIPLRLIMATKAPKWLLDTYLKEPYEHRKVAFDVGVLQSDSLNMDKAATLAAVQAIQAAEDRLIADEVAFLKAQKVDLVLADIPPLMAKIAAAADIPCWMISNFGWDFIYRDWIDEYAGFEAIAAYIAHCFSQATRTFRLPFHEPMSALPNQTDVGLTGGEPAYSTEHLRQLMQRDIPTERTVLLTFGGMGVAKTPYEALADFPDWQFVTFDQSGPTLPNLYRVNDRAMRPVDWMVVCDRVFSKPGYSTFSEACLLDKGVITITRDDFAEAHYLLEGIQDHAHHQIVSAESFFAGDWACITGDLLPPRKQARLDKGGKDAIAAAVIEHFSELS
ncbi:glycosyl transferase [cf. Phormidesmis sp. LEGE 11477]|uniref:glycosyl transferase n=1 Tax=cf. Phormidesmis sp. LEGE 11477 TaxID=1828680 RepID=UPI0018826027|nr:glycosyl transferase [cf. Phormidesmis sp. LEGE 11477]MBE9061824.1 glycosyl transferase [cf. Phormidesmis sp. LEGE 11477]